MIYNKDDISQTFMDPTLKLPSKPFIKNTQKILQCMQAEVQPFDALQRQTASLK